MRKLITWLYRMYGQPELVDISRQKHGIVTHLPIDLSGNIDDQEMNKEERLEFLRWCTEDVVGSQFFEPFMNSILKAQEQEIVSKVMTEKALLCGRSARHGAVSVKEQFERMADKHKLLTMAKKEVISGLDKFAIFE